MLSKCKCALNLDNNKKDFIALFLIIWKSTPINLLFETLKFIKMKMKRINFLSRKKMLFLKYDTHTLSFTSMFNFYRYDAYYIKLGRKHVKTKVDYKYNDCVEWLRLYLFITLGNYNCSTFTWVLWLSFTHSHITLWIISVIQQGFKYLFLVPLNFLFL